MAFEVSSITPDLVASLGKVVIASDQGKMNVTLNRIDISGMENLSGAEMQAKLRQMAKSMLQEAIEAL